MLNEAQKQWKFVHTVVMVVTFSSFKRRRKIIGGYGCPWLLVMVAAHSCQYHSALYICRWQAEAGGWLLVLTLHSMCSLCASQRELWLLHQQTVKLNRPLRWSCKIFLMLINCLCLHLSLAAVDKRNSGMTFWVLTVVLKVWQWSLGTSWISFGTVFGMWKVLYFLYQMNH